jgi:hypothetical protein
MRALGIVLLVAAACGPASRNGGGVDANGGGSADADPGGGSDGGIGSTFVYAHTATTLYRVDPDTLAVTMVGDFSPSVQMTDIAIDKTGLMIGLSFTDVYRVDPGTAQTTHLSGGLSGTFNGLSFIPATQIGQTGDDILVATRADDGMVFRVDPMTGGTTAIGNMGGYSSSGDLVAVNGFGTVQTATGSSSDQLVRLAPNTFSATPIGSGTGFSQIWGIAFWKTKIFGFTNGGEFVLIDPTTGVGTLVQGNGPQWWGAAVTTMAPVIQ